MRQDPMRRARSVMRIASRRHGARQRVRRAARQMRRIVGRGAERRRRADKARRSQARRRRGPGRGAITTMRLDEIDRFEHRVGDEHHGRAQRPPQRQQILVELEARDLVERGERLVHQQNLRLGDQRARDRDAHAHAARQFARIGVAEFCQADAGKRGRNARRRRLRAAAPASLQRQRDIVGHASPTASASAPGRRSRCGRARGPRLRPRPSTAPCGRRAQAGDQPQRRRFAAARRAEQRQEFAGADVEIELGQRHGAVRKGLADAAQRDERGGA